MLPNLQTVVKRAVPIFVVAGTLATTLACASSGAMRRGQDAERRQDYDRAVVEYTNRVRQRPNDAEARLSLDRAKIRAAA